MNFEQTFNFLNTKQRLKFSDLLKTEYSALFNATSVELNSTNPRQILYHVGIGSNLIPLCNCGAMLSWHSDNRIYRQYCSVKCSTKGSAELQKIKNLETIGVEWHSQLPEWSEKVKKTSLEKFGETHYSKTSEYKAQVIKTNIEKYNTPHVMNLRETKEKIKTTNLEKYGVEYGLQNAEVKEKIKTTNLEKYGVEYGLQNAEVKEKIKTTNLEKYGVEHAMQNVNIKIKTKNSRLENYYTPETLLKLNDVEWLTSEHVAGNTIYKIAEQLGVSASNLGKYFHKLDIPIIHHSTSALQRELTEYYKNLNFNILVNDRDIIAPKELDLFFVDYNLAVEVNGCYFHSEKFKPSPTYHLEKTEECLQAGITLLHFWDTELLNNWDQVINIINSKLKILSNKIFARKTIIKVLLHKEKHWFVENNHIQGDINSSINLGLHDKNGNIMMVATFGKARYAKQGTGIKYELLRMCSLKNTQIVGGASKLLTYFKNNYMSDNDTLLSYSDRRYSVGNVYTAVGFTLIRYSSPSFFYIDRSGNYAGSRYQWQKHLMKDKLSNYIQDLPASENMKLHGYLKVWDCGQLVFEMKK